MTMIFITKFYLSKKIKKYVQPRKLNKINMTKWTSVGTYASTDISITITTSQTIKTSTKA